MLVAVKRPTLGVCDPELFDPLLFGLMDATSKDSAWPEAVPESRTRHASSTAVRMGRIMNPVRLKPDTTYDSSGMYD